MCIYCRTTDEIIRHDHAGPVERVPSGRGVGGDVGAYGATAQAHHPSCAYMQGELVAALDALARLARRVESAEIMILELRAEARASREP